MKFIHIVQFLILQGIFVGIVIYFLRKIFYADTDSAITRLGSAHEDMLKKQQELAQKIELAEKEKQAQLLAAELMSARRRVNVLEHVVIPELGEQIKYIYRKLSEAERDNISRLMKIAKMIRGESSN